MQIKWQCLRLIDRQYIYGHMSTNIKHNREKVFIFAERKIRDFQEFEIHFRHCLVSSQSR